LGVEFLHIGSIQSDISHLPFLEVNVTNENPNGMIEAIKNENVDIVLLPSDIPETFNYVCHEAIIAGAAVVTYENSGNIARAVELYGQGLVVEGLNELMSVVEDINNGRTLGQTYYHTFTYSDMSFSSLEAL
jgi:glycosyltransferase involved in cell wall biosynthesis